MLHLLGKGGFAEVYLGKHVYMQSDAAVKVLHGPLATSDAQRFLQEAQTLVQLEHANIVGIKEFDIKQGIPFLVMNYASNGTPQKATCSFGDDCLLHSASCICIAICA
jgi:serine/threonine protein kinase